jgi:hypothetical protein
MDPGFCCGSDLSVGPCILSEGDLRDLADKVGLIAARHSLTADLVVDRGVSVTQNPGQTRPQHFLWAHAEIVMRDDGKGPVDDDD